MRRAIETEPPKFWFAMWAVPNGEEDAVLEFRDYETKEELIKAFEDDSEVPAHAFVFYGTLYDVEVAKTYTLKVSG